MLWVGDKGREIHRTWVISDEEKKMIQPHYKRFKEYVRPKLHPIFARFKFHNEVQGTETIESFLTRLRLCAKDCEYGKQTDEMIRDRIVFGTNSSKIREKLITVGKELTLDKTIQIAQSHEYSQEQLKTMSADVNYVKSSKRTESQTGAGKGSQRNFSSTKASKHQHHRRKNNHCSNCGRNHKKGSCPAKGERCNKCNKYNHFAAVCRTVKDQHVNAHAVPLVQGLIRLLLLSKWGHVQ